MKESQSKFLIVILAVYFDVFHSDINTPCFQENPCYLELEGGEIFVAFVVFLYSMDFYYFSFLFSFWIEFHVHVNRCVTDVSHVDQFCNFFK